MNGEPSATSSSSREITRRSTSRPPARRTGATRTPPSRSPIQYVICLALAVASVFTVLWAAAAVVMTGTYPERAQNFIVGAYRYCLRVETYVGALTDQYPPFRMTA